MIDLMTEVVTTDDGDYLLADKAYKNEVFESLLIPGLGNKKFIVKNVVFENCKTINGFFFTKQNILKNVNFLNFDCGDALHISTETIMENIKVAGTKPGTLWIRPENKNITAHCAVAACVIDISSFEGNVSITGIPLDKIRYNPQLHVPLKASLNNEVDWNALQLGPASYWKLIIKKMMADGATEGFFSMPSPLEKSYERAARELDILKMHGHIH